MIGVGDARGVFALLTVPLPPVLKINAATRYASRFFFFEATQMSKLIRSPQKTKPPPGGGGSVCFNVEIRGVEPLTS